MQGSEWPHQGRGAPLERLPNGRIRVPSSRIAVRTGSRAGFPNAPAARPYGMPSVPRRGAAGTGIVPQPRLWMGLLRPIIAQPMGA
jgi:hypothetical protein